MTLRSPILALSLMLAARPALAQQATEPSQPLLGPPTSAPPPEVRLTFLQVWLGTVGTTLAGIGLLVGAAEAKSKPLDYVSLAAMPAAGGWIVCGLGRTSPDYEGGCGPSVVGGYVGALTFGLSAAYFGATYFSHQGPDGGRDSPDEGAVYATALAFVVGAAVGATVAWHLFKRPRHDHAAVTLGAAAPPPAALAAWSELRARPVAARAPAAVGVPLLSLRF